MSRAYTVDAQCEDSITNGVILLKALLVVVYPRLNYGEGRLCGNIHPS